MKKKYKKYTAEDWGIDTTGSTIDKDFMEVVKDATSKAYVDTANKERARINLDIVLEDYTTEEILEKLDDAKIEEYLLKKKMKMM